MKQSSKPLPAAGVMFCLLGSLCAPTCLGADTANRTGTQPPRTFLVTRALAHERLVPYLETARPQIVQIGNYGAMFHGYADNENSTLLQLTKRN